jgi:tartrate-resistant acid phosphatase type 5
MADMSSSTVALQDVASTPSEAHAEHFVHLVDLSHDRALIAWGAFYFTREARNRRWSVVDDTRLGEVAGRRNCIGAGADPFGSALVQVTDSAGEVVAQASTSERTWAWVEGLEPDTEYRYRILVNGVDWVTDKRFDWVPMPQGGYDLGASARRYELRFRTWPHPDAPTPPVRFVALGDFGVGIGTDSESSRRQQRVADVLDRLVRDHDVRFVVSLGDTIYQGGNSPRIHAGNGDADADWYPGFFQPYRDVITQVPVLPTIGNHDTDDDGSDDREQMEDNFHLKERFGSQTERASAGPGLFYRLNYGRDLELVCIDTSFETATAGVRRAFQDPRYRHWLEAAFAQQGPRWVVPFSHHPAFCAGPSHNNDEEMHQALIPLFDRANVQLVLAGHEHNFQINEVEGRTYIVSGAGGKVNEEDPTDFDAAGTTAWAAQSHLLVIEVDGPQMRVTPISGLLDSGEPHPMTALTPDHDVVEPPFTVTGREP